MSGSQGPLSGLKVLDLTLNLPGPYATAVLAGLGADVVKLEPPRGDPARHMGPLFDRLNRGKRSVVLDLRDPSSTDDLHALIDWADVLVEGFRPGVTERLGCGPELAHARNPRLVYCRISAFGQTGPRRALAGHDLNLQSLTGLCDMEGRGGAPHATILPVADLSTSLAAVSAITTALLGERDQVVLDVAMSDALLSWAWTWDAVDPALQLDAATRKSPAPSVLRRLLAPLRAHLSKHRLYALPQYGLYRARDGWLAVGIVDERHFWDRFAAIVGLPLARRIPVPLLALGGPLLRARIARRLSRRTVADWLARFDAEDLPVTAVHSVSDALGEAQFARSVERGRVRVPIPGAAVLHTPAPELGADTDTVLAEAKNPSRPA